MNLLLLVLVPACFALNPVIGRAMSEAFGPASLSVTRWALSGLVIALVAVGRGGAERWHAPAALYGRLVVLGALGMGFCATVDALAPEARQRVRQANLTFIRDANVQAVETNVIYATLTKGR